MAQTACPQLRRFTQALALLTAASLLVGGPAGDLVEKCTSLMREYRNELVAATQAAFSASTGAGKGTSAVDGGQVVSAPVHGGRSDDRDHGDRLDVFVILR